MAGIADSIISALVRPFGRIVKDGDPASPYPQHATMALGQGITWTEDATNARGILSVDGTAVGPLGAATATSLTVGPYSLTTATIPTTDAAAVNLGIAVAIPVGKAVILRRRVSAVVQSAATRAEYDQLTVTKWSKTVAGVVAFVWGGAISAESYNPGAPPWAATNADTNGTTITGATSDGGTQVKIAVTSSTGYVTGNTITIAGAVTVTLILNGQWTVDSIPDGTHIVLRGSVWAGSWTSGGLVTPNGAVGLATGSTLQGVVAGIGAAKWLQGETVAAHAIRKSAAGCYLCAVGGTTLGSGVGPTGTGVNIDDNGVKWDSLGPSVTATWTQVLEVIGAG